MIYIVSEVYRSSIIISEIRTFDVKSDATKYRDTKMAAKPYSVYRVWESDPNSETFETKMVK